MKRLTTALLALMCIAHVEAVTAGNDVPDKEPKKKEIQTPQQGGFKLSGYIQTQFQWGEEDASLKVGAANENRQEPFNRFGIRRGRLKFTYSHPIASAVFQLDITEKGVGVKDAYLNISEPWLGIFSLRTGVFDRPFGFEISHSSSSRESPERSTIFQTLFPEERDLGAMLVIKGPLGSVWNIVELRGGLFAGNGIKQDNDSKKDFIGQLVLNKSYDKFSFGAGVSYYHGFVYQGTNTVYTIKGGGFEADTNDANAGMYAKRQYFGFDARFSIKSVLGTTTLRGEYIFGTQPGTDKSSKSPNSSSLPAGDTYIRPFGGGYTVLAHDIASTPLSVLVKYDWYDPNTKVAGNEIGTNHTGAADVKRSALGFGAAWHIMRNLKLTAYYDLVRNETSANIEGMRGDLKDNMFTLRLQYKF